VGVVGGWGNTGGAGGGDEDKVSRGERARGRHLFGNRVRDKLVCSGDDGGEGGGARESEGACANRDLLPAVAALGEHDGVVRRDGDDEAARTADADDAVVVRLAREGRGDALCEVPTEEYAAEGAGRVAEGARVEARPVKREGVDGLVVAVLHEVGRGVARRLVERELAAERVAHHPGRAPRAAHLLLCDGLLAVSTLEVEDADLVEGRRVEDLARAVA
jgi:hypothetical protein